MRGGGLLVRPLRVILNVAGLVVFPAALCGTATFFALDRLYAWLERCNERLDAELPGEYSSWLNMWEVAP